MFNGLPAVFEDRVQNAELYVQKRIYPALKFLTMLPMEQNETGLFNNYIHGDIELGDPQYTNNGITFNEIKFGQGQTVGGQTLPIGFKYNANTRDKQRGTFESNLLSFYNAAVVKIADFFEDKYSQAILQHGRQSELTLESWDTAEHIIDNELALDDEMRYNSKGDSTGYAPNTALVSRKDKLAIDKALRKEDYKSNWNYVASNKVPDGDMAIFDAFNPGASIEKYADPEYSVLQSLENDGISITDEGEALPKAFINVSEVTPNRPQVIEEYIWVESNLNMKDSNGFLIVNGS